MTPPDDDLIPRLSWRDVLWLAAVALLVVTICAGAVVAGRAMMGV